MEDANLSLGIDASKAKQGAEEFHAAATKAGESATKAEGTVKKLEGSFGSLGGIASQVKHQILGMATAFLSLEAAKEATHTILQFETAMTRMKALTNSTAGELEALAEASKKIGVETDASASQAAESLLLLRRAGLDTKDSILAARSALDLATISQTNSATATMLVADSLGSYQLAADQSARVTDVLTTAYKNSRFGMEEIATSANTLGPRLHAVNRPFEEGVAATIAYGDAMKSTSVAVGSLMAAYKALEAPSDTSKKIMGGLGLSPADIDVAANGLPQVLGKLRAAGLQGEDAFAVMGRGVNALLATSPELVQNFELIQEQMLSLRGTTAETANILRSDTRNAFLDLGDAAEELTLNASGVSTGIREIVVTLTNALFALAGSEDKFIKNAEGMTENAIASDLLATSLATMGGAIGSLAIVIGTATTAQWLFNAAIGANPYILAIGAVGGLIGALWRYWDTLVTVEGRTATVGDLIIATWDEIASLVGIKVGGINLAFTTWQLILESIASTLQTIASLVSILPDTVVATGRGLGVLSPGQDTVWGDGGVPSEPGVGDGTVSISGRATGSFTQRVMQRASGRYNQRSAAEGERQSEILSQLNRTRSRIRGGSADVDPDERPGFGGSGESNVPKVPRVLDSGFGQGIGNAVGNALGGGGTKEIGREIGESIKQAFVGQIIVAPLTAAMQTVMAPLTTAIQTLTQAMINTLANALGIGVGSAVGTAAADKAVDVGKDAIDTAAIVSAIELSTTFLAGVIDIGTGAIVVAVQAAAVEIVAAIAASEVTPFATGGIVTSPTRALIGEAGPEAVIPLSKFAGGGTTGGSIGIGPWLEQGGWNQIFNLFKPENLFYALGLPVPNLDFPQVSSAKPLFLARQKYALPGYEAWLKSSGVQHTINEPPILPQLLDPLFPNGQFIGGVVGNSAIGFIKGLIPSFINMVPSQETKGFLQAVVNQLPAGPLPERWDPWTTVHYASGGIVNGPTLFGMGGGDGLGLMGEAGPEAIMPLKRGPDGNLGVAGHGTGGTVVHMNIKTPDADSFRRNKRQIMNDLAAMRRR